MEHIKNLKKLLDTVANSIISNIPNTVFKDSILGNMEKMQQEILEIEKIQNYVNASTVPDKNEMVNHPSHYNTSKYECIEVMLDVFGKKKVSDFCELNAFKYLWRSDNKGKDIQDKEKARWYLAKYMELNKDKQ